MDANAIARVQGAINEMLPDKSLEIASYREGMLEQFSDVKKVKDSILLGGLVSLIISLMGLIGYIKDETSRRSSEMAIRKINGALPGEIMGLFVKGIIPLVVVASLLGNIAAYLASDMALEMFEQKTHIGLWIYIICDIAVMLIVLATVIINSIRISRANPVESLSKGE